MALVEHTRCYLRVQLKLHLEYFWKPCVPLSWIHQISTQFNHRSKSWNHYEGKEDLQLAQRAKTIFQILHHRWCKRSHLFR